MQKTSLLKVIDSIKGLLFHPKATVLFDSRRRMIVSNIDLNINIISKFYEKYYKS